MSGIPIPFSAISAVSSARHRAHVRGRHAISAAQRAAERLRPACGRDPTDRRRWRPGTFAPGSTATGRAARAEASRRAPATSRARRRRVSVSSRPISASTSKIGGDAVAARDRQTGELREIDELQSRARSVSARDRSLDRRRREARCSASRRSIITAQASHALGRVRSFCAAFGVVASRALEVEPSLLDQLDEGLRALRGRVQHPDEPGRILGGGASPAARMNGVGELGQPCARPSSSGNCCESHSSLVTSKTAAGGGDVLDVEELDELGAREDFLVAVRPAEPRQVVHHRVGQERRRRGRPGPRWRRGASRGGCGPCRGSATRARTRGRHSRAPRSRGSAWACSTGGRRRG